MKSGIMLFIALGVVARIIALITAFVNLHVDKLGFVITIIIFRET